MCDWTQQTAGRKREKLAGLFMAAQETVWKWAKSKMNITQ
jgi:hypothetical protein